RIPSSSHFARVTSLPLIAGDPRALGFGPSSADSRTILAKPQAALPDCAGYAVRCANAACSEFLQSSECWGAEWCSEELESQATVGGDHETDRGHIDATGRAWQCRVYELRAAGPKTTTNWRVRHRYLRQTDSRCDGAARRTGRRDAVARRRPR